MHQLPLHSRESQHQTGHQTFIFVIYVFWCIWMVHQVPLQNKESGHQTRQHTIFSNDLFQCILILFILILHQVLLHNKELRHQTGHQTYFFELIHLIYLKCASSDAPQEGVAAPDNTRLFCNLFIYLNFSNDSFELSSSCRSTIRSRSTRRGTRRFVFCLHY